MMESGNLCLLISCPHSSVRIEVTVGFRPLQSLQLLSNGTSNEFLNLRKEKGWEELDRPPGLL